jgi:hypothetical protein
VRLVAALVLAIGAAACDRAPARVTGEVYVVLQTGAQLEAVGAPVRLVADDVRTDTALARLCARRRTELAALGEGEDSLREPILERAWADRESLLREREAVAGVTDAGGRFGFDSVPQGSYRVRADAIVQRERWSWAVPVRLRSGDSAHVALGNHNADEDPFRCQLMLAMERDAAEE